LKVKPEISFMEGTGGGSHKANYKIKYKPVKKLLDQAKAYLDAGAYKLMLESEGITEDLPVKKWRTDIIRKAVDEIGIDKWMFEASDPVVFKWYLKNFGPEVNLFIDHSQVFEYNAWRHQLWGDHEIWKGKSVRYR
jgi:phosphosulfolactate synthase (CoM biosynthesis protein A)